MKRMYLTFLLLFLLMVRCTPAERPLRVGEDQCKQCYMTISDEQYGGEIVMTTGKVLTFDSIECLASYVHEHQIETAHSLWVVDFANPGTLIPVHSAAFVQSDALHSPMGMNLTAFNKHAAESRPVEGRWMTWNDVRRVIQKEGMHTHTSIDAKTGHIQH